MKWEYKIKIDDEDIDSTGCPLSDCINVLDNIKDCLNLYGYKELFKDIDDIENAIDKLATEIDIRIKINGTIPPSDD